MVKKFSLKNSEITYSESIDIYINILFQAMTLLLNENSQQFSVRKNSVHTTCMILSNTLPFPLTASSSYLMHSVEQ